MCLNFPYFQFRIDKIQMNNKDKWLMFNLLISTDFINVLLNISRWPEEKKHLKNLIVKSLL